MYQFEKNELFVDWLLNNLVSLADKPPLKEGYNLFEFSRIAIRKTCSKIFIHKKTIFWAEPQFS